MSKTENERHKAEGRYHHRRHQETSGDGRPKAIRKLYDENVGRLIEIAKQYVQNKQGVEITSAKEMKMMQTMKFAEGITLEKIRAVNLRIKGVTSEEENDLQKFLQKIFKPSGSKVSQSENIISITGSPGIVKMALDSAAQAQARNPSASEYEYAQNYHYCAHSPQAGVGVTKLKRLKDENRTLLTQIANAYFKGVDAKILTIKEDASVPMHFGGDLSLNKVNAINFTIENVPSEKIRIFLEALSDALRPSCSKLTSIPQGPQHHISIIGQPKIVNTALHAMTV